MIIIIIYLKVDLTNLTVNSFSLLYTLFNYQKTMSFVFRTALSQFIVDVQNSELLFRIWRIYINFK